MNRNYLEKGYFSGDSSSDPCTVATGICEVDNEAYLEATAEKLEDFELSDNEIQEMLNSRYLEGVPSEEAKETAEDNAPMFRFLEYPSFEEVVNLIKESANKGLERLIMVIYPYKTGIEKHRTFDADLGMFEKLGYKIVKKDYYGPLANPANTALNVKISWE